MVVIVGWFSHAPLCGVIIVGVVAPLPPSDSTVTSGPGGKPVSSVAPVYSSRPGYTTPTSASDSFSPGSKPSSTPLSVTPSRDQESPTKLRPALPPLVRAG